MGSLRNVAAGDKILADDWNRISAAVKAVENISGNGINVKMSGSGLSISSQEGELVFDEPAQVAYAENISGARLDPLDVVMVTWPIQLQDDQAKTGHSYNTPDMYMSHRMLEIKPPEDWHFGRFAVVGDTIGIGESGAIFISGVCLCSVARKFDVYKPGGTFRFPDRADTVRGETYLQLSEVGAAQVLWMYGAPDDTTDPVPAVIRFDSRNTAGLGMWEYGNLDNRGVGEVLEFDESVDIEMIYPAVLKLDKHEDS